MRNTAGISALAPSPPRNTPAKSWAVGRNLHRHSRPEISSRDKLRWVERRLFAREPRRPRRELRQIGGAFRAPPYRKFTLGFFSNINLAHRGALISRPLESRFSANEGGTTLRSGSSVWMELHHPDDLQASARACRRSVRRRFFRAGRFLAMNSECGPGTGPRTSGSSRTAWTSTTPARSRHAPPPSFNADYFPRAQAGRSPRWREAPRNSADTPSGPRASFSWRT